jgi:replicative DNA helicase
VDEEIVRAPMKIGENTKTAITVNMMIKSAMEGNAVTYIPAETGPESIVKRAIAIYGNLPVNAMRHPSKHLNAMQMDTYKKTIAALKKLPLHIEELHDIREIRQLARERTRALPNKKHLFIIDHLGHLSDGKVYQSRNLEFEEYCKALKAIAKDYNIALILLSQLSRGVEQRPDKRPMNSDLRDSGAIEQIADVITFLYRENYYLPDDKKHVDDVIEFIISKNRDGGTGTKKLRFLPNTNRVVEL